MQILYEVFQKTKGERKLPNNHGYLVGGQTPQSCQVGCCQSSVLSPRSEIQTTLLMELTPSLRQSRLQAKNYFFCVIITSWVLRNWGYAEHSWGRQLFAACDFITENMERVKKVGQQVTTAGWGLDKTY